MIRAAALVLVLLAACAPAPSTVVLYSRHDSDYAQKARDLARVFAPVHFDRELRPGAFWRAEMGQRICGASHVLLIWSEHAARSVEVARELQTASACQVPVIAVLLDSTPLPHEASPRHAVDWRGFK